MSYKGNIANSFMTEIAKFALTFISSIVVYRSLGPEGKGFAAYFMLVFGLISSYGHFGINNAVMYFKKKSKYTEEEVFNVNITYLLSVFIIISFILFGLKKLNFLVQDFNAYFLILGMLFVLANFIFTCVNSFYVGDERIKESNKFILANNFIQSLLILILYFINLLNIYTLLTIQVFTLTLNTILLLKYVNIKFKPAFNRKMIIREFNYGIVIYFASLFIYLNYRVDQFIIKNTIGTAELGIYALAVSLSEMIFLIPTSIRAAYDGKIYNTKDKDETRSVTSSTIKSILYSCFAVVFIGMMCTPLITIVYGDEYVRSIVPTIIMFLGVPFAAVGQVVYSYFTSSGRPRVHLVISFITLVINVICNIILIPRFGINGAALASTISYTIFGTIYILTFVFKEKFKIKDMVIIKTKDIEEVKNTISRVAKKFKR